MNQKRRMEINEFAQDVRAALDLEIPIELEQAIAALGGELEDYRPEFGRDAEAYVRKVNNSFAISIKPQLQSRLRFSLAHEIGHLFLHLGYLVDDDLWESVEEGYRDSVKHRIGHNNEEYEANEFAAALLMPAAEFKRKALEFENHGRVNIDALATYFGVSKLAAANRGKWLGVFEWQT